MSEEAATETSASAPEQHSGGDSQQAESSPANMADVISEAANELAQTPVNTEASEPASDRPDYLLEKFKTIEDQAKGYVELEKVKGKASVLKDIIGAPEDGYSLPDKYKDNEAIKELSDYYKEKGFSQDFLDKHINLLDKYESVKAVGVQNEIKKLGENGKQRLESVKNFVLNNFNDEQIDSLKTVPINAGFIKFLEGVKSMSTQTGVPVNNSATTTSSESITDIQREMRENFDKIQSDDHYASELNERMLKAGATLANKR